MKSANVPQTLLIKGLNSDCSLVSRLSHHGIYFELVRVGRKAQICCKMYYVFNIQRVNSTRIRNWYNWYNSTITEAFLNEVLVLMEIIFIRDGSFDISGIGAPFNNRVEINLFISLICCDSLSFELPFIALHDA